jgi:tRNA(Ser,Leu) C12 N-acetylase TAN1
MSKKYINLEEEEEKKKKKKTVVIDINRCGKPKYNTGMMNIEVMRKVLSMRGGGGGVQ